MAYSPSMTVMMPNPNSLVVSPEKPVPVSQRTVVSAKDDEGYPEGGLQAWLVVLRSFLVYFSSFGIINSFSTFQARSSSY